VSGPFLLAVLVVSMIVGLVRGFVFEVMSLLGWLVAWFGSQYLARELAPHLPIGTPGSAGNMAAAYVLCFVGILIVWTLLAKLVRLLVHATPLSFPTACWAPASACCAAACCCWRWPPPWR
jgi:membrane protein required for colicin V production